MTNRSAVQIVERLLSKRSKDEVTGCWNFIGSVSSFGHATISYKNKMYNLGRFIAFVCLNFDLNSPLHVLHKCDNPRCFNPLHLFLGTHEDNMHDRFRKGRLGKGHSIKKQVKRWRTIYS